MKKLFLIFGLTLISLVVYAENKDYDASTVRMRGSSKITFDASSYIADEESTSGAVWNFKPTANYLTVMRYIDITNFAYAPLTASKPVMTDASKKLVSTNYWPISFGGTGATTVSNALNNFTIQRGSVTTTADGTITNTFTTAYAAAPVVLVSPTTNVVAFVSGITTTNCIISGETNGVIKWVAFPQ